MTWLDLPATKTELDRAMKRIGFPDTTHAGARAIRYKTEIVGLAEHLIPNPGIDYLNRLAACLAVMNRAALRRFTLFLRTEEASGFVPVLRCAKQLTTGRGHRRQTPTPGR